MTGKKVKAAIDVNQVRDGLEYKGNFIYNEHRFQYEVAFKTHIKKLFQRLGPDPSLEEFDKLINVKVYDENGEPLTLDDKTKNPFIRIAGMYAIDFYHDSNMRSFNDKGIIAKTVRGKGIFARLGLQDIFRMSAQFTMKKIPELEKLLENYKGKE